jgi:hypothetical protein
MSIQPSDIVDALLLQESLRNVSDPMYASYFITLENGAYITLYSLMSCIKSSLTDLKDEPKNIFDLLDRLYLLEKHMRSIDEQGTAINSGFGDAIILLKRRVC